MKTAITVELGEKSKEKLKLLMERWECSLPAAISKALESANENASFQGRNDWVAFQNLLQALGGVHGYAQLGRDDPKFLAAMIDAYGIKI